MIVRHQRASASNKGFRQLARYIRGRSDKPRATWLVNLGGVVKEMFDHGLYRRMREKLGAVGAFPEVWDKVRLQPELRTATARTDEP